MENQTVTEELTQEELIRKIGYEAGMNNTSLIEKFFAIRFPSERNESYIGEWVSRFKSGNPVVNMDYQSLIAYVKVVVDVLEYNLKVKIISNAIKKAREQLNYGDGKQ